MSEQELKRLEENVKIRIKNEFDCSQETADFIVNLVASFHCTRGGALLNIDDYMEKRGF